MAAEQEYPQDGGACAGCGRRSPGAHVCDLELLLSCYVELDPTPQVYGELLAHWLTMDAASTAPQSWRE